ncbi:MAG: STAS domain-containing protein [Ruminococcaceae bacterium]|nr:STAS domain-containing protein [Oscillospiraceae bacterium]MBQ9914386.1 anti-sigma factor antagonist [Clostridia bacterium]
MSAKLEYTRKEIRVYLDGEIDHHSASLIRTGIDDAIILRRPELLILDFDGVSFMDSSAIGLVMGRYKLMRTHSGKIKVDNLSPSAYKVMKLAGIEKLGEIRVKETVG